MSTPLVSIVIPCHNAARWIGETLESTLQQRWPRVEVIVVDDGSTDDSVAVAEQYQPRGVRVLRQSNGGASSARNRALREARGDFIQFLDADDLLSPSKIAAQMQVLRSAGPRALASCRWGRFSDRPENARFVDVPVYRNFTPIDFLVLAGDTGAMMHPAAWLTPRQLIEAAGPWDESLNLNDDGEYFSRIMLASTGIVFCDNPDARTYYRSAMPGSLSQRRSEAAVRSQFRAIELTVEHMLAADDSPRTRRAAGNYYRRFVHDFHPVPADLGLRADSMAEKFGATLRGPSMGPKSAALARLIGWKTVLRLKRWLRA